MPQAIYTDILSGIEKLLHTLSILEKDSNFKDEKREAIKTLSKVKNEVSENIKSLERNSEWNTFTVAFYGETNAGKSTLIESLRILLKEKKKVREHQLFQDKNLELNDLIQKLDEFQRATNSAQAEMNSLRSERQLKINFIQNQHNHEIDKLNIKFNQCEKLIEKSNIENDEISQNIATIIIQGYILNGIILDKILNSTWSMIKSWFNNLDEQKEVEILSYKIRSLKKKKSTIQLNIKQYQEKNNKYNLKIKKNLEDYKIKESEIANHIEFLEQQSEAKLNLLLNKTSIIQKQRDTITKSLEELSDGKIIGDGSSDFTQEVGEYHFSIGQKKFVILDLPGIEGKEELVQTSINSAIEKAHVIFYVSKKPNPPQKGDNETLGTIEKISKQLSKQSEVYFIYNKPVRNPRQLRKPLIDESDEDSLLLVDEILSETLNDNYVSHQSLSAYPALLALGNFYDGKYIKDCEKFLISFKGKDILLELSQVEKFGKWMIGELVDDVEEKIVKSNYKKIKDTLDMAICEIAKIQNTFEILQKKCASSSDSTFSKLDDAGEIYYKNIINDKHKAVNDLKNNIRNNIYKDIDTGINDEIFEKKLEKRVEEGILDYTNNLKNRIDSSGKEFNLEVADIVDTHQRYSSELIDKYSNLANFQFNFQPQLNIKKNGDVKKNVLGLTFDLIGIVTTVINAGNPVFLAVSALIFLFRLYKKSRALFDKDFHKSQQRNNANENIDNVIKTIDKEVDEQLLVVHSEVINTISSIKEKLNESVMDFEMVSNIFLMAKNDMNRLSCKVISEEGEYYGNS